MKKLFQLFLLCLCLSANMGLALHAAEKTITPPTREEGALPPQFAEELRRAEEEGDTRFFKEFLNMLFYLGIIILFILILMWVLKRLMSVRTEKINQTSSIKILEHRALTPKTTVYVLEIFGKAVAIADSVDGVTFLSETDIKQDLLPARGKTLKEQERE